MSAIETIAPQRIGDRLSRGEIELIDVRTPVEFREIHVQGARNVPLDSLDPQQLMQERDDSGEKPVYVICKSGNRGERACQKLQDAGFAAVYNVDGGTLACADAGLPVARGKKAISLERQVRIVAGSIVLISGLLAMMVHPYFAGIAAFIGAGLTFAGITDTCGMGMMLAKMPWNQVSDQASCDIR